MTRKIGFIGAGNMAEAIIKGVIEAKVFAPGDISISDIDADRLDSLHNTYMVNICTDSCRLTDSVDNMVLSVKPQNMAGVLEQIKGHLPPRSLVISIAAGITVKKIADALGDVAIVRVMPNSPALIGQAATAIFANQKAKPRIDSVLKIFSALGEAVVVDKEDLIDAVTAVSGSGPAYFFLLAEEMIKAGIELGLDKDIAKQLVLQTAKGAALLAEAADNSGQSPAELRRKVTSPGGTTAAAIEVFGQNGFGQMVSKALKAAADRSRELSGSTE